MERIQISRTIAADCGAAYRAFLDGTVFELTGAAVTVTKETFRLTFAARGEVAGEFLECSPFARMRLSWNVSGFDRADERTLVEVTISPVGPRARIDITHSAIGSPESAAAKERAWASILADLDAALDGAVFDSKPFRG